VKALSVTAAILMGIVVAMDGCDGKCSGPQNCPGGPPNVVLSTVDLPSAVVEVSADAPCTATLASPGSTWPSVLVIDDRFDEALTCYVHGRLADGQAIAAMVTFQVETVNCCPVYAPTGGGLNLSDGGADGP